MKDVSIILPLYNEQSNAKTIIDQIFKKLGDDVELIIIDDGSTDNTKKEIPAEKVIFIEHSYNQGKGEAIKSGLKRASREIIAFIDGDLQDDPADLIAVCDQIRRGKDVVIGSRFLDTNTRDSFSKEAVLPINEIGNKSLTKVINFLFGASLTDTQASIKAFKREVLTGFTITSKRYEIETELIIRSIKSGCLISEVPVSRYKRENGISNLYQIPFGRFRFALRALKVISLGIFVWR